MQTINPQIISGKKVLLRLDIDVPTLNGQVTEDFRLRAGIPTLKLCIENASKVTAIGHLGNQNSVAPVREWFKQNGFPQIELLENLRFDPRESFDSAQDYKNLEFARELAAMGDIYVNEAFASYHPAASTTILPTLLPHAAGLRFVREVGVLRGVRENPKKPFIAIMGGAKVKDKLPVIAVLAQSADAVLVGGKLIAEIREQNLELPKNVMVGMLNEEGTDIAPETTDAWSGLISKAAQIVWNGPVGKFEDLPAGRQDAKNDQTRRIAQMVLESGAEIVIGGGDSVAALSRYGLLEEAEKKAFVSTGGGAMLKLLANGTLPTIEALK